jgi:hypothetical protein
MFATAEEQIMNAISITSTQTAKQQVLNELSAMKKVGIRVPAKAVKMVKAEDDNMQEYSNMSVSEIADLFILCVTQ